MFQDTESVHSLIHSFNECFIIAGWISLVTMIVIIIFLPRGITKPLIRMKEATSQINEAFYGKDAS